MLDLKLLGRALIVARSEAGFTTQRAAARAADVDSSALNRWELGKVEPSTGSLVRLLDAYNLSLAEFESIWLELEGRLGPYEELTRQMESLVDRLERVEQSQRRPPDGGKPIRVAGRP